jgi:hypothetical protein
MAVTIAGITVNTFGQPGNDTRIQNVSSGQAQDGSWKFFKIANSDKAIRIPLHGFSTALKDSLSAALEADADGIVTIVPPSHISLGGAGAGVSITAKWDCVLDWQEDSYESWSTVLNFIRVT